MENLRETMKYISAQSKLKSHIGNPKHYIYWALLASTIQKLTCKSWTRAWLLTEASCTIACYCNQELVQRRCSLALTRVTSILYQHHCRLVYM